VSKNNSRDSHGSHQSAPKYSTKWIGLETSHVEFTSQGRSRKNTSVLSLCDSADEFSTEDAIGKITMNETTIRTINDIFLFEITVVDLLRHVFKRGTLLH
jgi:hypothetical protein